MTQTHDRTFPPALAAVAEVEFEHDTGMDFEPRREFLSAEDTADWIRAWTDNPVASGDDYLVFGQDGTGGYAAVWLVRPGAEVVDQPVVFLGSEGELGVVAGDLAGFLWVLAGGVGPYEATEYPEEPGKPHAQLRAVAERFAPGRERPAVDVVADARREFPDFADRITALVRQS
ncbi:SMI1/KNR4 family protein [Actinosynnema sp. NPDC050436]|uniref:SMI1/KNR4 family protein n=1 Tax=Actinosynnema sp. NPDC050436 TaxID=3155659 RepID=UPI00340DB732